MIKRDTKPWLPPSDFFRNVQIRCACQWIWSSQQNTLNTQDFPYICNRIHSPDELNMGVSFGRCKFWSLLPSYNIEQTAFANTCISGARSNSKRRPWNPTVRCWANWPRFHVQLGSSIGWTMGRKDTRNGWNAPWYMLYTCLSTHVMIWVETILWWYELYDSYYSCVVTVITVTCSMSTRVL